MSTDLTWGEKLEDLRKERKMTLAEAAEQSELSASTISNYENGGKVTAKSLCKLLQAYGITVDEFYGIEASDYQADLETFKRYGFSEKFFQEFVFLEKYNGQQITKCLNRLLEPPLYTLTFFENLSQALDPANYEKLVSIFPDFSHDAYMRFLLEPVFQSLTVMFNDLYSELQS